MTKRREPQIALCTSVYNGTPLDEALPRIAELGFGAVELVADVPHLFPPRCAIGQVQRLREALDACGLQVANVSAETARGFFSPIPAGPVYEPSLITPQGASRRSRITSTLRVLDFAFALGAPCVTLASGVVLPGSTPGRAWEHLQEALAVLLARAEELGVLLAIAPRPGHLIGRTEDLLSLLEALPHPLLGISLDLAQMAQQGESVPAAALACAGRIWCVQLTDAKLPQWTRTLPGEGTVDLPAMLEALRLSGYDGPYTLQLEHCLDTPDEAALDALATALAYVAPLAARQTA